MIGENSIGRGAISHPEQEDATAVAATLTETASVIGGAATGSATAVAATLTETASVISGAATGSATAVAATLTETASVIGGAATGSATAVAAILTETASVIGGAATGSATAVAATLTETASVIGGVATGDALAIGATIVQIGLIDCYTVNPQVFWNPIDKSIDITVSGGGYIATSARNADRFPSIRANKYYSTGKRYFSITPTAVALSHIDLGVGLADSSALLTGTNFVGKDSHGIALYYAGSVGQVWFQNTVVATVDAPQDGIPITIAVDLDNHLFWFRVGSGNWNADPSANPVTGIGGITGPTGALTPAFTGGSLPGDQVTANFGAIPFPVIPTFVDWEFNTASGDSAVAGTTLVETVSVDSYSANPQVFWSNTDHSVDFVVSGGGLIATGDHNVDRYAGIRANTYYSTGKRYFSVVPTEVNANHIGFGIGLANADALLTGTNFIGVDNNGIALYYAGSVGQVFFGHTVVADIDPFQEGTLLTIAVDLDASPRLVWWRVGSGYWNADPSANPTTGVGGIEGPDGPLAPAMTSGSVLIDEVTANFGATPFPVVTGFNDWENLVGGIATGDATANAETLSVLFELIPGEMPGDATATDGLLTVSYSLIPGIATGQIITVTQLGGFTPVEPRARPERVNARARGALLVVGYELLPGVARGTAEATGALLTTRRQLISGIATGDATATKSILSTSFDLISGKPTGEEIDLIKLRNEALLLLTAA